MIKWINGNCHKDELGVWNLLINLDNRLSSKWPNLELYICYTRGYYLLIIFFVIFVLVPPFTYHVEFYHTTMWMGATIVQSVNFAGIRLFLQFFQLNWKQTVIRLIPIWLEDGKFSLFPVGLRRSGVDLSWGLLAKFQWWTSMVITNERVLLNRLVLVYHLYVFVIATSDF